MKKYISVLAIIFIISLAACSNQTISSTPTGNESNIQSNSITTLDKGIWPVNEYIGAYYSARYGCMGNT